jgi:hypothetical protein
MDAAEPRLEHIYDMHVDLEPPQMVGQTPAGTRQIFILKGGTVDGPKLKGEFAARRRRLGAAAA